MTEFEYIEAKKKLPAALLRVKKLKPGSRASEAALADYLEALIAIKGHAWCMDVKSERRKIVRLLIEVFPALNGLRSR